MSSYGQQLYCVVSKGCWGGPISKATLLKFSTCGAAMAQHWSSADNDEYDELDDIGSQEWDESLKSGSTATQVAWKLRVQSCEPAGEEGDR